MKRIRIRAVIALLVSLTGWSSILNAQTNVNKTKAQTEMNNYQTLDPIQESIVTISALTATGDLENLQKELNGGLDSGLTVNEIKDVLVQLYAYCGFPRSLNAINAFMSVLEERKKRGINDETGKTATPIADSDKYERGRKTLETLTRQPQSEPAKGFGEFSSQIDRFLKEHLFADIFDSDVLSYQQRELVTISALAAMPGVEPQVTAHLLMGINTGLAVGQLNQVFDLIEKNISREQAEIARTSLAKVLKVNKSGETKMEKTDNKTESTIFPKGERAPADYFTGTVFLQMLAHKTGSNDYSIGSVTFAPGGRSNWHTHPAGQTLIVIDGTGLYQEKGRPVRTINKGETIICDPDTEHWHGASPECQMTHLAITNDKGRGGVVWLGPVTDEEYNSGGK